MEQRNTTGTMDISQLLIIVTPLSLSLLASLILNILLACLLAKMVLRDKPEVAATQSITKTTCDTKDCEVYQQPIYSTVRHSELTLIPSTSSLPHSPANSDGDYTLKDNPLYQSSDPLSPNDPSYCEVN